MRPALSFSGKESALLIAIYENPQEQHTTYSLAQRFNVDTKAKMGTPEYGKVFHEARTAIEELIVRGLVQGTRLKGADGVYFSDLKLRYKGEQAALQERQRVAEFKKNLPEMEEHDKRK